MSDVGFHSGLYQQIREYAELVDEVLIDIKDGISLASDSSRRKVGALLISLGEGRYNDFSTRLLVFSLRGREGIASGELSRLGKALLGTKVDEQEIGLLERFARTLEQEQAVAMARMRGL